MGDGNMRTYHDKLRLDVLYPLQRIVVLPLSERVRVDVGGEVAYRGLDTLVERTSECQMTAQTHARGADTPVAGIEIDQAVDG